MDYSRRLKKSDDERLTVQREGRKESWTTPHWALAIIAFKIPYFVSSAFP
jgi:hypothetical protein